MRSLSIASLFLSLLLACNDKDGGNGDGGDGTDGTEGTDGTDGGDTDDTDDSGANVDTGGLSEDADGDGYDSDEDCNDDDASINPGATELCDELDNDCDSEVDEDLTTLFYLDADEDGFGDPAAMLESCEPPEGHVPDASDCDDASAEVFPGATEICDEIDNNCDSLIDEDLTTPFYADQDGDGYGDPASSIEACSPPEAMVEDGSDCDDTLFDVNPGAAELCDALDIDEDCSGAADDLDAGVDPSTQVLSFVDADNDSYGDETDPGTLYCDPPTGTVSDNTDCDDAAVGSNPGATEVCDAANADEDCDGTTEDQDLDVDLSTGSAYHRDFDSDGFGDASGTPIVACDQPAGTVIDATDCDDRDGGINPGATEICDAADTDEDCSGAADDADTGVDSAGYATFYADTDSDGYGDSAVTIEACDLPTGYSSDATDCDDSAATINPGATEICDAANTDEDCDTLADNADSSASSATKTRYYSDADSDGYGSDSSPGALYCDAPSGSVATNTDCDDGDSAISPASAEVCDGADADEDCDGFTDDGDSSVLSTTRSTWYIDADNDTYGSATTSTRACDQPTGYRSSSTDCDDSAASINPGATEVCDAADTDEDCDSLADDADSSASSGSKTRFYPDADLDGFGSDSSSGSLYCDDPSTGASSWETNAEDCDDSAISINPLATEICDGLDNDCDGLADNEGEVLGEDPQCAAFSCLDIFDTRSTTPADGEYHIDPDADGTATEVWCDMSTDGGGYTFYKVDYGSAVYASAAESHCASLGMQLFIPRTEAHRDAAFDIGYDSTIGASGNIYYLGILGIYPDYRGANCVRTGFNSDSCTVWSASDDEAYWVSDRTDITEPNGDNDPGASMYYWWTSAGALDHYNDIYSPGYSNYYFMCDVGDKY